MIQGLPTELSLRRDIERGRVYLIATSDEPPLGFTFSGTELPGRHHTMIRIDVTDLVDGSKWQ